MNKTCIAAIALIGTLLVTSPPARAADFGDCRVGAYRLPDGTVIDISPSSDRLLRWRRFDGTTGALTEKASGAWTSTAGWTEKPDGIEVRFQCAKDSLNFGSETARRIPLAVTESRFDAGGTALVGRLVLPPGKGRVPIVVLVHGSEDSSARTFYSMQRLLPARGVGVYVYDKRGTGESGGTYTQDFERLADDAVAALHDARRLAGKRAGRMGYLGTSQGGWVAPLAARREAPDLLIVAYGLAVSVIDEDREAIELEMRLKGHSPDEIAKALEVASAAEAVFESRFTSGFAELLAARAKYEHESWYPDLQGNFTHFILGMNEAQLRATAQTFGTWGTPFRYDPMPTLRALHVPQLWVLGEDDLDAPSAETARRLQGLADAGQKISIAMFPGAEHGITEFEIAADGTRVSTRYAPGYFEILRAFALEGRVRGTFGRARISRP
jgi:pimeloyl-ACP methyl ester carboxylesterase